MQALSKRVLAAHDLSGIGHTSLVVAIAVFYRLGIRVAALPTAILSANTDHPGYSFLPFDDGLNTFIDHWQELKTHFDAIYSGFLGGPDQVDILIRAIDTLAKDDTFILVDPVLGDQEVLYSCYDADMIPAMRRLVAKADLITPNTSEVAFLLGEESLEDARLDWEAIAKQLCELGPRQIAISSIPSVNTHERLCGVYDEDQDRWQTIAYGIKEGKHPGSGDMFASFLLAGILNGYDLFSSCHAAVKIIDTALDFDTHPDYSWREGPQLERLLQLDLHSFYR
ncbi:MAG TPA: pyridoxamine kinase [Candidatus Cloacimonetes bacterium]|jgi:pyridoxine kinase|nr:pyridoxamine kinase [Candidatus Cloacimonadota bacterium]